LDDVAWVTRDFHEANPKSQLQPGDVLITRVGANAGDVCTVPHDADEMHLSSAVFARPKPEHRKYVELFFRSPLGQYILKSRIVGSVSERINTRDVESLSVLLPPPSEKSAIACIFGALDDKIELNRRINRTLESIARAIFKSWFVDFDPVRAKAAVRREHPDWPEDQVSRTACPRLKPEIGAMFPDAIEQSELGWIPKGWRVSSIKAEAAGIQYGLTQRSTDDPVGPRFLRITDLQGGQVNWQTVPYCIVSESDIEKYRIMDGDIFVARTGASTGENIYVVEPPRAVFASYLVRFKFDDHGYARIVGEFMRSENYFSFIESALGGSAQPNASAQTLAGASLVFPSAELGQRFYNLVRPLDLKRATNDALSRTIAALRDALLPKLISGELRVPDAERIVGRAV
jgi:type I restriction enzyme S subunit